MDVNVIRYEFERRSVTKYIGIPGEENLADPGTKFDSPLVEHLRITLEDGHM